MSKTEKNLMDAFAGESQANRKYLAFAKQADKEGLPQVAKLFRAAAEAETIHAHATSAMPERSATPPPTSRPPSKAKPTSSPRCILR